MSNIMPYSRTRVSDSLDANTSASSHATLDSFGKSDFMVGAPQSGYGGTVLNYPTTHQW
jgi:hypothetical protein